MTYLFILPVIAPQGPFTAKKEALLSQSSLNPRIPQGSVSRLHRNSVWILTGLGSLDVTAGTFVPQQRENELAPKSSPFVHPLAQSGESRGINHGIKAPTQQERGTG